MNFYANDQRASLSGGQPSSTEHSSLSQSYRPLNDQPYGPDGHALRPDREASLGSHEESQDSPLRRALHDALGPPQSPALKPTAYDGPAA